MKVRQLLHIQQYNPWLLFRFSDNHQFNIGGIIYGHVAFGKFEAR